MLGSPAADPGTPGDVGLPLRKDRCVDDVLQAERAHLAQAREGLARMRAHTRELLDTQAAWGNDELTSRALAASLARRHDALLDDGTTPLFFGRLDHEDTGEVFHVGRRHVTGEAGEHVVVDWRAPVSEAFYTATPDDRLGVALRRRFGFSGGALTAYEDDRLQTTVQSALLVEEVERPRSGPMRDIVATVQPDQDVLVRAPLEETLCVQGAPGTGKTAVGLHRAAYLLYAHRQRLASTGVLVVGPNRAFLAYVQEVLPALGEVQVTQVTADDLAPPVRVTGTDDDDVAVRKGDAGMAQVLERALWATTVRATEPLVHATGTRRWRVWPEEVRELERAVRGRGLGWEDGRRALAGALAHHLVRQREDAGGSSHERSVDVLARSARARLRRRALAADHRQGPGVVGARRSARGPRGADPRPAALDPRRPAAARRGAGAAGAAARLRARRRRRGAGPVGRCSCGRSGAGARPAARPSSATRRRRRPRGPPATGTASCATSASRAAASRR